MKRSLCLLMVLVLLAIVGGLVAPYRHVTLEARVVNLRAPATAGIPATVPVRLVEEESRVLRLTNTSARHALGGAIVVRARGAGLLALFGESEGATGLGPGHAHCSEADAAGVWSCRLPFRFRGARSVDLAPVTGQVDVLAIDIDVLTAAPVAQTGLTALMSLFAVLSVFGAVAGLLKLPEGPRADAAALFGAVWLLVSGGIAGGALLVLVGCHFISLRAQMLRSDAIRGATFTVSVAVVLFATVKIGSAAWIGGFANPGALSLGVPLGMAFFLVRALDLSFRVATLEVRSLSPRQYVRYMLFPATLTAGPIYTLRQFEAGASDRVRLQDWTAGAARIAVGLAKKLLAEYLLAREIGPRLIAVYGDPGGVAVAELWLMLLSNALYVYLDFSGYSDIAIGIGRQLGWRVPENFDFPIVARSMREFWRRWHITLSAWVARWVHFFTAFELRHSPAALQAILPVVASLLVIAMWHEIQLSWVAWGAHHATGILAGDALGAIATIVVARLRLPRVVDVIVSAAGIGCVWAWVALSHCFTLISAPGAALRLYGRAFGG